MHVRGLKTENKKETTLYHLPPLQNCKHQMLSLFPTEIWFVLMTVVWIRHQLSWPCFLPMAQNRHIWSGASKPAFGLKMNAEITSMDTTGHSSRNAPSTESPIRKPGSTIKSPPAVSQKTSRGQSVWNTDSRVFKNHLQNDGCQSDHCKLCKNCA